MERKLSLSGDLDRSHFNLIVHGRIPLYISMSDSEFNVESNATNNQHSTHQLRLVIFLIILNTTNLLGKSLREGVTFNDI
jgi:hypothetical protein